MLLVNEASLRNGNALCANELNQAEQVAVFLCLVVVSTFELHLHLE
jgi:hypothetical protein